jgi:ribokinase
VEVEAAIRKEPTRRGLTILDSNGERTIITIGDRLAPRGGDSLDWGALEGADGVYFTAGDQGALRAARAARVLVATPRAGRVLGEAGVELDALVYSAADVLESRLAAAVEPRPALLVATSGAQGGRYEASEGRTGTWAAAQLPGPLVDTYGSGDTFAAALTYGLAAGEPVDASLELAAAASVSCLTRRGPYGR